MDPVQAAGAVFSPATIAAIGPTAAVILFMGIMLWVWVRGREERQAKINEDIAKSLREDQRELFERQAGEIEGLKVDRIALEARLKATEELVSKLRGCLYEQYVFWREANHAANNARDLLVKARIMSVQDFEPLPEPRLPKA
ncbi:hypothetical protein SAMN02745194_02275 [Roseomonas rosea]|uniref:Uncharacterized protein n=1 Tax=Muricoccus roseus TaxID=198092 RepID=A0A1M6I9E1_9PROT|nr:hypothetical protein [Roseomonas rosea]SHJ31057.1 hypothetical protein SAMN02745194_02275 [Roseomonas rosea]